MSFEKTKTYRAFRLGVVLAVIFAVIFSSSGLSWLLEAVGVIFLAGVGVAALLYAFDSWTNGKGY